MPDLDRDLLSNFRAEPYVYSVMLFPRDPRRQDAFFQSLLAAETAAGLASSNDGSVCRGLVNWMHQAPRPQDVVNDRQWQAIHASTKFVSWALQFVLTAASDLPELASITNAIKHTATKPSLGSVKTLKRAWSEYESVAHFWMAKYQLGLFPFADREGQDRSEEFRRFLAAADAVREMGEAWKHLNAHTPVLDPELTWKVPCGVVPAVRVELTPFTPDQHKFWRSQLG